MSKPKKFTFNLDNNEEHPVSAGGVLFYRKSKKSIDLLLVSSRGMFEDLGGRVDAADKTIFETVSREVKEESNKQFSKRDILKRVKACNNYIYMARSKYVVYILPATDEEAKLESSAFGDREIHDDIARTIKWIPLKNFLQKEVIEHKLNWRLKSKQLFDKLKQIENRVLSCKSVFSSSEDSNGSKE